jgi:hypothetical protein
MWLSSKPILLADKPRAIGLTAAQTPIAYLIAG